MTTEVSAEASGHCRYTYRLRLSSTARTALGAEWDRLRWVWNECVAKSKAVHAHNRATGEKTTCDPVQLAAMRPRPAPGQHGSGKARAFLSSS